MNIRRRGVGAALGAGIGATSGHFKGGMSNDDLEQLGATLEEGQAGPIVIDATNMADQVAASIKRRSASSPRRSMRMPTSSPSSSNAASVQPSASVITEDPPSIAPMRAK